MANELKFRVILSALNESYAEDKEVIAFMLAITLDVPLPETQTVWQHLPAVLFDNLTSDDLKKIKDRLLFLSKLGLDFSITAKPFAQLYRTNWQIKSAGASIVCPNCGESLLLMRAQDIASYIASHTGSPTKQPAVAVATEKNAAKPLPAKTGKAEVAQPQAAKTPMDKAAVAAVEETDSDDELTTELEEVEVLSKELEAIVAKEDNLSEDIEEVESISEEVKKVEHPSEIEPIGGISAEFEEIDGVSAEFEKVCVEEEAADTHIGSLSAEMEEIEGISAELEAIQAQREPLRRDSGKLTSGQATLTDSREYELEEIEDISAVMQKVSEPAANLLEKTGKTEANKDNPPRAGEGKPTAEAKPTADAKAGKIAESKAEAKPADAKAGKAAESKAEAKPAADAKAGKPVADAKKSQPEAKPGGKTDSKANSENDNKANRPAMSGSFDVMINFSGKGNIQMGIQLLAKLKGMSPESAANLAEQKTAIVVANNVPQEIAERIIAEFAKVKMQGRIIPTRGTDKV